MNKSIKLKKTTWIYLLCRESGLIFIVLRTICMELFRKVVQCRGALVDILYVYSPENYHVP